MDRESMVFYRSFWEALSTLNNDDRAILLDAILSFGLDGAEPEGLQGYTLGMFLLIRPQIEANNRRYENGTKGGRPKKQDLTKLEPNETKEKPNQNQTKPNVNETVSENNNVSINKTVSENNNVSNSPLNKFEKFVEAYPKAVRNRHATETAYCKLLRDDAHLTESDLIIAAENYAEAICILGTEERYIKEPQNFLKDNFWVTYAEGQYVKLKPQKGGWTVGEQHDYDFEQLERELLANGIGGP